MEEKPTTTRGIQSAQTGALSVLQHFEPGPWGDVDTDRVREAAEIISTYQRPSAVAVDRHEVIAHATARFLQAIVSACPPGPERSTAISRAREARMWANAGIALEGK